MSEFFIGIDLGTTNSVISYLSNQPKSKPQIFELPQYVDATTIEKKKQLPSFIYRGLENEQYQLPWQTNNSNDCIGYWAQKKSSKSPDRTIATSKSWLSNHLVDGKSKLLPTNAPDDLEKISPVEAAKQFLATIKQAWDHENPEAPFSKQKVSITIPASFDASAKDLTIEAAKNAGYPESLILLEEPQAALYSWLASNHDEWQKKLKVNEQILIIDVGGGTADFSLIKTIEQEKNLELERIAVGRHLLVGGDNMDLALAHFTAAKMAENGSKLDAWQNSALWHACRQAKESLLDENGEATFKITVAGKGKSLIGNSISAELNKEEVQQFLLNGFFPICPLNTPITRGRSGFQQTGLPYETEAAITKHLAQFMQNQTDKNIQWILFNGGVFKSSLFQNRVLETITSWSGQAPNVLNGDATELDLAVAKGSAWYLFNKNNGGLKIRGGTARSYYLGFEAAGMAIPGIPRPIQALCIVPKGLEEGQTIQIESDQLGLVVGDSNHFPFFSCRIHDDHRVGDILRDIDDLEESVNIRSSINSNLFQNGEVIPVKLEATLSETGVLEIYAKHKDSDEKWKFEFNARENE